jgi:hypothetical protein
MVTLGGFIEFEHAMPKMQTESTRAVAMTAGDTLIGTRIARGPEPLRPVAPPLFHNCSIPIGPKTAALKLDKQP